MALQTPSGGAMVQNDPTKIQSQIDLLKGQVNTAQGFGYKPDEQLNMSGTLVLPKSKVSTTTVGNGNKINQVGTSVANLNNMSAGRGITTDANGVQRYADGSLVPNSPYDQYTNYMNAGGTKNMVDWEASGRPAQEATTTTGTTGTTTTTGETPLATADTSTEDKNLQDLMDMMKASTDASTKALIDSIQKKFEQRRIEQTDINQRQLAGTKNALLMGGVTGQGSSAQYAPISSGGIITAQESYGIKQLADLDAQEADLIAQANAAKNAADYKLMEAKMTQIEKTREAKMTATTELNKKIIEQNQKVRDANLQSQKDNAVTDLYSQGITDPTTIMNQLKKQGIIITAKEVADAIKNITPPGLDDLIKNMRSNNAPQDLIQKVLGSTDINQAYETAGNYGAGGTGIIAEYNYAKANGYTGTFSDYQNEDANRKRLAVSTVDTSGMTTKQQTTFLGITNKFQADTIMATANQAKTAIQIADQAIKNPENAGDQLTILYTLVKNLDPNSAVREGELSLAQTTQSYLSKFQTNLQRITEGKVLSAQATKELAEATKSLAQKWQEAGLRREKQYKAQAQIAGVGNPFNEYLNTIERPYDTANDIVQTEKELVDKISEAIKNPETKKAYDIFKQLAPDATASEIAKHLGITQ